MSKQRQAHHRTEREIKEFEGLLKQIPIELRVGTIRKGVRNAGKVVIAAAKPLVPRGDPSHKPENKPLYQTITQKVESYRNDQVTVSIVGPAWPAGAHGHLVEDGHVVRSRGPNRAGQPPLTGAQYVQGVKFLAPPADSTRVQQERAIVNTIVDKIKEVGG